MTKLLTFIATGCVLAACGVEPEDEARQTDALGGAGGDGSAGGSGSSESGPGGAAGQGTAGAGCVAGEAGAAGAGGEAGAGACPRFASEVLGHEFGPGQSHGREHFPDAVFGPPAGGGERAGAVAGVVSLGNGGWVELGFGPTRLVDGPGPDFTVFENAFNAQGDPTRPFAELATVSVSADGATWHEFPCAETEFPYGKCAGWHAVLATDAESALDPARSGGDPFDLADLGLSEARFVRIEDRVDLTGFSGVFDLDAVAVLNAACP